MRSERRVFGTQSIARRCATVVFSMVGLHQGILLLNLACQEEERCAGHASAVLPWAQRQSRLATDPSGPIVAVRGIDGEKGFTTGGGCGGEGPAGRAAHDGAASSSGEWCTTTQAAVFLLDALAMQAAQGRRLTVGAVAHAPRPFPHHLCCKGA